VKKKIGGERASKKVEEKSKITLRGGGTRRQGGGNDGHTGDNTNMSIQRKNGGLTKRGKRRGEKGDGLSDGEFKGKQEKVTNV